MTQINLLSTEWAIKNIFLLKTYDDLLRKQSINQLTFLQNIPFEMGQLIIAICTIERKNSKLSESRNFIFGHSA